MSFETVEWALNQKLKPFQSLVLIRLCRHWNPNKGSFPSLTKIADDCGMSKQSVINQIKTLVESGLVRVEKRKRDDGSFTSNKYHPNLGSQISLPPSQRDLLPSQPDRGRGSQPNLLGVVKELDCNNTVSINTVNSNTVTKNNHFDILWKEYPKKVSKKMAEKAFIKAEKKIGFGVLLGKVKEYAESVEGKDSRYILHFATFLNQERWEDTFEKEGIDKQLRSDIAELARLR